MDTKPNNFQKAVINFASSKPGVWLFSRLAHHFDRAILRLTKNHHSLSSILSGKKAIMLTTVGAKSGLTRRVPLLAVFDADKVILIATNWGQAKYPAWYHNMKANPVVQLSFDDIEREYVAQEVESGNKYDHYWHQAVMMYLGYKKYKERISGRRIPIMVLTPKP